MEYKITSYENLDIITTSEGDHNLEPYLQYYRLSREEYIANATFYDTTDAFKNHIFRHNMKQAMSKFLYEFKQSLNQILNTL